MVTDHDLAMESVLDLDYLDVLHILCNWHMEKSFMKNFGYLSNMKLGELKQKIISLIWIEFQSNFDNLYKDIISTLQSKKLDKSLKYLQGAYNIKHKWARSYLPWTFTGGTH